MKGAIVAGIDDRAKTPISPVLAGPYGHPFHPILVTVPIGAWVASLVFDIVSRLAAAPAAFTLGARWLIAIGVLGALAAAGVGFLDFYAIPTRTPVHRTALLHLSVNLTLTLAYALNFFWRGQGDPTRTPLGPLLLSVISLAGLGVSGYLGGKLAYHYGVRVAAESVQAEGFTGPAEHGATSPPQTTGPDQRARTQQGGD
ncbi:putative membrane protein [Microlunatus panaciterrae]|uniref:Membrane protein n=1 Tax=Microlunatus panaciterrae TaxID=400768 RepID=A0ABS2RP28_9ACTN|nr:putative membrane protein [Microlunatus panaciterrae]